MIVKEVKTENIDQTQTFLFGIMKTLFGMEKHPVFHKDVIHMKAYYVDHPEMTMLAAYDEGDILGTIAIKAYIDRFEAIKERYKGQKVAELARCYIRPDKRRCGIGGQLFKALMSFCIEKNYDVIYLHTHRYLPGGIHFWMKHNFSIIYEDVENDIVHMEIKMDDVKKLKRMM